MAINRFRTRTVPVEYPPSGERLTKQCITCEDTSVYLHQLFGQAPLGVYRHEWINDEVGAQSSTRTRPCESGKLEVSNPGVYLPNTRPSTPVEWGDESYLFSATGPVGYAFFNIPKRGDYGSVIDSFNRRSIRKIIDEIPTQVSLPTFIGELPDIPRTIRTIYNLRDLANAGLREKTNNFRDIRANKDKFSDPVLGYNFGVVPLWNDIKAVLSVQTKVVDRINELQATRGRLTKFKHGGKTQSSSYVDEWGPIPGASPIGPFDPSGRWRGTSQLFMKSGGHFYHQLGGLSDFTSHEAAVRSSLGLDNMFKTGWDLIPFSFLADYFTNIGDILSELKTNDAFTGDIQLKDTWTTQKIVYTGEYQVRFRLPNGFPVEVGSSTRGTLTEFIRTRGIPTSLGPVLDTTLGLREAVNILALV